MTEPVDYFTNHRYKTRFPWRLYHGPIISALRQVVRETAGDDLLNLGSGPFLELSELGAVQKRMTLCDIDSRSMDFARELHGTRIQSFDTLSPNQPLPYPDASFDLVVSMDVVEHIVDPEPWLRDALRVVRPGGTLFLTTPNYASWSLRLIENTALELVARRQGFSRKLLHPSKMTPKRLHDLLAAAGGARSKISAIAHGWVLASMTTKA